MAKKILIALGLMLVGSAYAAISVPDQAKLRQYVSIPANSSGENGLAGWAVSTGSFSVSSGAFVWDASASSQTFISSAQTVPTEWQGRNGVMFFDSKCASGTCTHTYTVDDGTNNRADPRTVVSSTTEFQRQVINFVFPTSGSIRIKVTSAANEPSISMKSFTVGLASDYNVSQGSASYPWTAYTPTTQGIGTPSLTECFHSRQGPTLKVACKITAGTVTATELRIGFPSGLTSADTSTIPSIRIAGAGGRYVVAANNYAPSIQPSVTYFTMSAQNNNGIPAAATGLNLFNNGDTFTFVAEAPIAGWNSLDSSYKPELIGAVFSGRLAGSGGGWDRNANTSYGDFSVATTSTTLTTTGTSRNLSCIAEATKLPGITCPLPNAGRYLIVANFSGYNSSTSTAGFQLVDGSGSAISDGVEQDPISGNASNPIPVALHGVYAASQAASVTFKLYGRTSNTSDPTSISQRSGAGITWSVIALDQPLPTPILVGGTTNGSSTARKDGIVKIDCDGSPSVLSNGDNMVTTSVSGSSAAGCSVTWATGYWASGSTPDCTATAIDNSGSIGTIMTSASVAAISSSGATVYRQIYNEGAAAVQTQDGDFMLYCRGNK